MASRELDGVGVVSIRNETRQTQLGHRVDVARSFWHRGRGLMFRADLPSGSGLVIDPCSSIHTMWMRFAIDVLYVDGHGQITRADREMKPWRFGPLYVKGKYVIELPPGTIAASGTERGDRVTLTAV